MARARFLHTADLHLSRPFGFLPPQIAEERRRDQRRTLARIADLALEREVDFALISGDVFDRPDPDTIDVEAVTTAFAEIAGAGKPVFVIPGNHDCYSASSIWRRLSVDGVRLFAEPEYRHEVLEEFGIAVAGIAFDRAASERRAFDGLEIPSDVPCVVLTHASYESFEGQIERYHPFSEADLARVPAVYVALGHYHRLNTIRSGKLTACYPGSPEGLGFDPAEAGERYVIIGEITDDSQVQIEPVQVNLRAMRGGEIDCTSFESADALHGAVRKLCGPNAIVQIRLTGTPPRELSSAIDEVADRFKESCFYLSVDTSRLSYPVGSPSGDRTILGMFRKHMLDQIEGTDDPERRRLLRRSLDLGLAAFTEE